VAQLYPQTPSNHFSLERIVDKVQKQNSFNTNTPSSESYKNYLTILVAFYNMHGLQWDYSFPQSPHGDFVSLEHYEFVSFVSIITEYNAHADVLHKES
jgi:hypothetical protein